MTHFSGELEGTELQGNERQDLEMYKQNFREIAVPFFNKYPEKFGKTTNNKAKKNGKKKGKGKSGKRPAGGCAATPLSDGTADSVEIDREKWFGEASFLRAVSVVASR